MEFQGVLARLEKEKADLHHALTEGHDLLQQSNTPEFLEQTVHDLEERLKETERLTEEKQKMLTVSEMTVIGLHFDGETLLCVVIVEKEDEG